MAPEQKGEGEGVPVAAPEFARAGKEAQQPAEYEAVRPWRDIGLASGQKGDGGSQAQYAGPVTQVLAQAAAEALLHAAANGEHDDAGTAGLEAREQFVILNGAGGVVGREVGVGLGDGKAVPLQPRQVARGFPGRGHDPEDRARGFEVLAGEHGADELQSGMAGQLFPGDCAPQQHHVAGIGDGEVGGREGFAVGGGL